VVKHRGRIAVIADIARDRRDRKSKPYHGDTEKLARIAGIGKEKTTAYWTRIGETAPIALHKPSSGRAQCP
jgi:hypothetical protein